MTFLSEQLPTPAEIVELPVDDLALRLLDLMAIHQQGALLNRTNIGNASIGDRSSARKGLSSRFCGRCARPTIG